MRPQCRREADRRYRQSAKGKAREARYSASAKGKARKARNNAKCLKVGTNYIGYEPDGLTRERIQAYINQRLRAFKETQCSVETPEPNGN